MEAVMTIMGTALLGVIAWAFTLGSRVAVLEANKTSFERYLNSQLDNITARLVRIEAKLDREE